MASSGLPPLSLQLLKQFEFVRVLNDDPALRRLAVLGTLPTGPLVIDETDPSRAVIPGRQPAILTFQKSHFASVTNSLVDTLSKVEVIEANDIYGSLLAWKAPSTDSESDFKVDVVLNATDLHIRKATRQKLSMFRETRAIYEAVVLPYIESLPPERIQWVYNILARKKEAEKIVFEDPSPVHGFILLPDLKWDLTNAGALYLVAIVHSRSLRSMRDLRKAHIPMLKSIRREAIRVSAERWGVDRSSLRMYLHYQPSYYHLHIHIVHVDLEGFAGMNVGHAHLLDDVISLLETEDEGVLQRMTLSYCINRLHPLYEALQARQDDIDA